MRKIRKDTLEKIKKFGRLDTSSYRYAISDTQRVISRVAIKDLDTMRAYSNIDYFTMEGDPINH